MRTGLLIFILIFLGIAQADIFRSKDRFGNITFSDRPSSNAERVELDTTSYRYKVMVSHVIDGDTLVLNNDERIRLIGINTPEVESRYTRAEPGGDVARDWLRKKLQSLPYVWLEYDVEKLDKYDRQLAHVFLESGEYLNESLLQQGLAMLTLKKPNLRYSKRLIQAQQLAEEANKGIWQRPEFQPKTLADLNPGSHYRGWQRWRITPRYINESRKYMNLTVSQHFVIAIAKSELDIFPPLTQYLNQQIEVRGWLRKQGNQYFMQVHHPSAIKTS